MVRSMTLVGVLLTALAAPVWSQEDPIPPGLRAGQDAYQEFEGQRRAAAGAQVELNQILRNRLPWSSPYGDTIYYVPPGYGYGTGYYIPYPSLFAYSYAPPPIRQPIGMRQVQTGPRRWESYPVYGDEPGIEFASPDIVPRERVRASERVREPEPPPAPAEDKPRRGPREF